MRPRADQARPGPIMKIILVNRYFFPDQSATARIVSSIAFSLAERGYDVVAVASRSGHDQSGPILPATDAINGVKVKRLASAGHGRQSLLWRVADYLLFHALAFFWLLRNATAADTVVVCTDPPLLSVTASIAIRVKGALMVNWIMDLFPETAIELGFFRHCKPLGHVFVKLRNWSLRTRGITVCPTGKMAEYLHRQGVPDDQLTVMHLWADGEEIYPVPTAQNRMRERWGLRGAFVVGYSGNFGRAHEFVTIIEAAKRLRNRPDIKFLMIGSGHQHSQVLKIAARLGLCNIIFKPFQPVSDLAESLGVADVHLVSLLPELEHCIIPSKLYGIMAAGRPTIFVGDPDGEISRILATKGCGRSVPIGADALLAAYIERLEENPAECGAMGHAARELQRAEYSRERAADAWCSLLARLEPLGESKGPLGREETA